MGDFTSVLNNFTGGKVSEKYKGRFDLQLYQNSLEEFKNFFMGKIGGAYKRTGTIVVQSLESVSSSISDTHTAIPFDSGKGKSYILFIPNSKVKIDGGLFNEIYVTPNINNWVGSAPNYSIGSGITARVAGGVIPAWPSTVNTAFSTGSWIFQQVGDVLFLTHSSGEQRPLVLTRTGDATFDLNYYDTYQTNSENLSLVLRVPYLLRNVSSITLGISGTTMTASASLFTANMVGSLVRIADPSGTDSVVVIRSYSSATSVTIAYLIGASTTTATDDWQISAWSDEYGWPTSVTYHNQRLYWGGNIKYYDYTWASLLGNLFHMMATRLPQDSSSDSSGINFFGDASIASDPFDFRPASTYANATTWLSGGRVLMVGTSGGENIVNVNTESINSVENSNYGSYGTNVLKAGKDVIFVGKDRRTLRTYRYSDENGSWLSDDLSSKAEDIFFDGAIGSDDFPYIKQIAWNPDTKQIWVLLTDSKVKVCTYDPEYGMAGWSDVIIGGYAADKVAGVITLPDPDRTRFETYLLTTRYLDGNGTNSPFLEKISGDFKNTTLLTSTSTDIYDFPRYLDFSWLDTADGSGKLGGFTADYAGNVFDCFYVDSTEFGIQLQVEVVSDGSGGYELDYTFPANAKILYGYKYDAEIKMLPMDAGGVLGSAISDIKDISRIFLKLYRSMGFKIGSKDQRSGLDLSFETVSYDDLYTGEKEIFLFDNPDSEEQAIIRSEEPYPLNIIALIIKGDSKR